jgi:hypothetical protein
MNEPLKFDQVFHNEAIYWLEQKWGYKLTQHERYIVAEIYNFARTKGEENEVQFLFDLGYVK